VVKRVAFAVPGDLATPTGGYAYDRRMIAELQQLGWQVDVIDLGDGFPRPSPEQKTRARSLLAAVPPGCPIVIDGLALGVLPEACHALHRWHPLVALVHHPLALETGMSASEAEALRSSERAALAATRAVIVTSQPTARLLNAEYGVGAGRITVAPPGTDHDAMAAGSTDGVVRLLSVGAVVPRKGFDVLMEALATLADLPWRLVVAGDTKRDPATTARLEADIVRFGLKERVQLLGAVAPERVSELYAGADVFVLASRFEGYGMAFAEAMAHGLPIVGTTGGAIPETVPAEAGILVPPEDSAALAAALRRLIEDPVERKRLAEGARNVATTLPTWAESAKLFARAVEAVG
jgi:glycosyltransferase involved in cell wall biosynthesis